MWLTTARCAHGTAHDVAETVTHKTSQREAAEFFPPHSHWLKSQSSVKDVDPDGKVCRWLRLLPMFSSLPCPDVLRCSHSHLTPPRNGPALTTETFPPHENFILSFARVENLILVYIEYDEDSIFFFIAGDLLVSRRLCSVGKNPFHMERRQKINLVNVNCKMQTSSQVLELISMLWINCTWLLEKKSHHQTCNIFAVKLI